MADNKTGMDAKMLAQAMVLARKLIKDEEATEAKVATKKAQVQKQAYKSLWQSGDEAVANAFARNKAKLYVSKDTMDIYYGENDATNKGAAFSFSLGGLTYSFSVGQKTRILKVHEADVRAMISDSRYPKGQAITTNTANDATAGISLTIK